MCKDPSTRVSSIEALQASPWLADQDWDALREGDRATTPPFVPINALTTPGFDEEFLDPTAENFDQAFTRCYYALQLQCSAQYKHTCYYDH